MAIDLLRFANTRPYLYHLTARGNLTTILEAGRIHAASSLFAQASRFNLMTTRRRQHVSLTVDGVTLVIRDQAPLHRGNMRLTGDMTFENFVSALNARVFFWPGGPDRPIAYGVRHYERYASESPVVLRIPTKALLSVNPDPEFCRFNSGSPRCSKGVGSPRGPDTFMPAETAAFSAGKVIEVTFQHGVDLPSSVEVGDRPDGPWRTATVRAK